jgi:hypothetical protein
MFAVGSALETSTAAIPAARCHPVADFVTVSGGAVEESCGSMRLIGDGSCGAPNGVVVTRTIEGAMDSTARVLPSGYVVLHVRDGEESVPWSIMDRCIGRDRHESARSDAITFLILLY